MRDENGMEGEIEEEEETFSLIMKNTENYYRA